MTTWNERDAADPADTSAYGTGTGAIEKLLPQNIEAEAAFLGSVLIDPDQLVACASLLRPEDFYRDAHRIVWEHMLALAAEGVPADAVTLPDELERYGKLADAGGASYVTSLGNTVPHSLNAPYYADIVARQAALRRCIHAAGQIAALAYTEPDPDTVYAQAMTLLGTATARPGTLAASHSLSEVLDELLDDTLARVEAAETLGGYGLKTHFTALDRHIVALEPGELVYVAGRPGSGKSAWGLTLALNVAMTLAAQDRLGREMATTASGGVGGGAPMAASTARTAGTVEYVTLEMPRVQQARRLVVARSGVSGKLVRAGFRAAPGDALDQTAYMRHKEAVEALRAQVGQHLHFHDGAVSLATLRAAIQKAVGERHARLVVVDQLDLFADEGRGADASGGGGGSGGGRGDARSSAASEFERITRFSRALKQLALQCGVAIVCLAQLNRQAEYRGNKRPMLADLRASGQLEQDADHVWGLYRPAYYQATLDGASPTQQERYSQYAELLVLKGRDVGAGGMLALRFEAEAARFTDWPSDWPMPADPTRAMAENGRGGGGGGGSGGGGGAAGTDGRTRASAPRGGERDRAVSRYWVDADTREGSEGSDA